MARRAVEDVIGGEVDQLSVDLAAGKRQITYRQRVDLKGRLRLLLGDIHLVVSRGVEDDLGVIVGESVLNRRRVGDVHLRAVPRHDGEPAML